MALFGDVLSIGRRNNADKARRQIVNVQRRIALRRTIQARRAFLRNARSIQADNLVQGGISDFGSSRFQGQQASIQTQKEFGLFEQRQDQEDTANIETFAERAARNDAQAATNAFAGNAVQAIVTQAS